MRQGFSHSALSPFGLIALACFGLLFFAQIPTAHATDNGDSNNETEPSFFSELDWTLRQTVGTTSVHGSNGAHAARSQHPDSFFGGIDLLRAEGYVGESWRLDSEFRALAGRDSYEGGLKLTQPGGAYLDLRFNQFRVYDSPAGGYLTNFPEVFEIDSGDLLFRDRRFFRLELGNTGFDWGHLYLRYNYTGREGDKHSTIWGLVETDAGTRGIMPSKLQLDEERHFIEAGLAYHLSEAAVFESRCFIEKTSVDNTTWIDNSQARRSSRVTYHEKQDADSISAYASLGYRFNDQFTANTTWSYSELEASTVGSQIHADDYNLPYDPSFSGYSQGFHASFRDLMSDAEWKQTTFQINGLYTLTQKLAIIPSIRLESVRQESTSSYEGLRQGYQQDYEGESEDKFERIETQLELRYRPSKWLHWNVHGLWAEESGDMSELLKTSPVEEIRLDYASSYRRRTTELSTGFDLKPINRLVLRFQTGYKEQDNDYGTIERDRRERDRFIRRGEYPGHIKSHERKIWDLSASATWRANTRLTSVTRLDYQWLPIHSTAFTNSDGDLPGQTVKSETENFILSQSFTWTPRPWLTGLLQGNYVRSKAESPFDPIPDPNYPDGINHEIVDSKNDYATVSVHAQISLSAKSTIECSYTYLKADNFFDNSADAVPYGLSLDEHIASATYSRQLKEHLLWKLAVGGIHSEEKSSGGNNNFDSFTLATSVEMSF